MYSENFINDGLVPVLIQSFGVILMGYFAGRLSLINSVQAQGISFYVTKFALPAVFFRVMVTTDFTGVSWLFILSVSIGKLITFAVGIVFTILLSYRNRLGTSALVAMFVSQSNDVALAYPILYSLYPKLASYIYLFGFFQLTILNPIAYLLLEWNRANSDLTESSSSSPASSNDQIHSQTESNPYRLCGRRCRKFKFLFRILWNVFKNPLFFMTAVGVICSFILNNHLPTYIDSLLKVIADSFSATALFSLGFGMVNKMGQISGRQIYILLMILFTKLIISPFVTREIVSILMPQETGNLSSIDYSTFSFLYASTPTAPTVYMIALDYNIIPVTIGVGLVLGTFLSGPIMLVLCKIITMYNAQVKDYHELLTKTILDITWLSVVCCIWTLTVLFVKRKWFLVPYRFTICLLITTLISYISLLVGYFIHTNSNRNDIINDAFQEFSMFKTYRSVLPSTWKNYVQFGFFFYGCTGARVWTALIAFVLYLERARSLCFILRYQSWIFATGFILPFVTTAVLFLTITNGRFLDIDPVFQYGKNQLVTSLIILLMSAILTISFIIAFFRLEKTFPQPAEPSTITRHDTDMGNDVCRNNNSSPESTHVPDKWKSCNNLIESPPKCSQCNFKQREKCKKMLQKYNNEIDSRNNNKPTTSSAAVGGISSSTYIGNRTGGSASINLNSKQKTRNSESLERSLSDLINNRDMPPADEQPSTSHQGQENHHKHVILIIFLLISIFFGICLCTWRLVKDAPSGIYIVLEFLDSIFNFGQGLLLFVLFGLDAEFIVLQCKRLFAYCTSRVKSFMGTSEPRASKYGGFSNEIVYQFTKVYLESCSKSISKNHSMNSVNHSKVFKRIDLQKWIERSDLAQQCDPYLIVDYLEQDHVIIKITNSFSTNNSSTMSLASPVIGRDDCSLYRFSDSVWKTNHQ